MKTAISLPDDLFASADALAAKTGCSRSQLYAEALREYLARHDDDRVMEKLNEVCAEVDTSLPPYLAHAASCVLSRNEW